MGNVFSEPTTWLAMNIDDALNKNSLRPSPLGMGVQYFMKGVHAEADPFYLHMLLILQYLYAGIKASSLC